MSKNMLFITFLLVFIACSMFITLTAHSMESNDKAGTTYQLGRQYINLQAQPTQKN
jgi:hypothetical protein